MAGASTEDPAVFQVPPARLLQDWKEAHDRALAYLAAVGVPDDARVALVTGAVERALRTAEWAEGATAVSETLRALRGLLCERYPASGSVRVGAAEPFTAWRVDAFWSRRFEAAAPPAEPAVAAGAAAPEFTAMPPLNRRGMVPEKIERRALRRVLHRLRGRPVEEATRRGRALRVHRRRLPWTRVARLRRMILGVLVFIPSIVASGFMINVLPHQGGTWLEVAIVLFFGALFGWISIGFWTATLGFFRLVTRRDRFAITNLGDADLGPFQPEGRTAVVMPICEEPVERVFAGLRAIYESLERTGGLAHFDFFVLSDSYDPSTYAREEDAWARWCRSIGRLDRVFYRRRRARLRRKSGNVADFCRRWGKQYRYMIMLDADSIMSGEALVRMVQMMDTHHNVGMIQTAPRAVNRRSLLARVQQFSTRVYGPMFTAGLHFWQLGDGQYWGHNTIIRIVPFMDHCGLPRLPGGPPLGGEILSHDFVEAALMGRSGWTLWLAYDLEGSYEEVPSTLLEEMNRDRRWCQGNLQHLRLLFTEGLFGAHRALFLNGVLSYVSASLWFSFLGLSTAEAIMEVLREPEYFPHGASLFPEWPIWRPDWAYALLAVTGMILFLPKVLSILLIVLKTRNARAFGGVVRLTLSVLLEIVVSSLMAPIRMVFHTKFVLQNLMGRTVVWRSLPREDAETTWGDALRHHGLDTLFASAWGLTLYWLSPNYFWWVTPIVVALVLSVPVSVCLSRVRWGDRTRAWGLFLIPEERDPPRELQDTEHYLAVARRLAAQLPVAQHDGFVRVAADPTLNAIHRALGRGPRSVRPAIRAARRALLARALTDGPDALDLTARRRLLADPQLVTELHERVWALADRHAAARWMDLPDTDA